MQARRTVRGARLRLRSSSVIGLILIGAFVSVAFFLIDRKSFDVWGGFLLTPVLIAVSIPALRRQAAREADPRMFRIMLIALLVKLAGAVVRYYVAFTVYGGGADAARYHIEGVAFATAFRHLDFTGVHLVTGTPFMGPLTGAVYTLIGSSKLGGFVFFSWLGFWGLFLFYRAFTIAVPDGPAPLVRPSRLLPAVARLLAVEHRQGGMDDVQPGDRRVRRRQDPHERDVARTHHLRRGPVGRRHGAPAHGRLGRGVVGGRGDHPEEQDRAAGARSDREGRLDRHRRGPGGGPGRADGSVPARAAGSIPVGGSTPRSTDVQSRTSEGGSSFVPSIVDSPASAPLATVTVLFRPFVFETDNLQGLLAAIEGTALLILCLVRFRWGWAAMRSLRRQPYVVFCFVYTVLFIIAYSSYANFGLLARQRVQLYPLFLVLLSIPPVTGRRAASVRRDQLDAAAARHRLGVSASSRRSRLLVDGVGALLLLLYGGCDLRRPRGRAATPVPEVALILGAAGALVVGRLFGAVHRAIVPAAVVVTAALAVASGPLIGGGPLDGPFGYRNATGAFCVLATIAALMVAASVPRWWTWVLAILVAVPFAIVAAVDSAAAGLSLLVIVVALIGLFGSRWVRVSIVVVATLFGVIFAGTIIAGRPIPTGSRRRRGPRPDGAARRPLARVAPDHRGASGRRGSGSLQPGEPDRPAGSRCPVGAQRVPAAGRRAGHRGARDHWC